ncbi:MLP-like protein 328 [Eucalyptus grandis]|uniref:MLP-like protein 328 n=1 Tax=Eucalyptus grandis TaxID=71139 RepID=UPI00192EAE82|nr:MLP-like protein 328 [Eucalyptus grandis]
MTLAGTLETELELKSPADKYFKRISSELHHAPNASSDKVHAIEVHEGDWETPGSVKLWTYTINGKEEVFKEKIEVDEAKKSATFVAVGGHLLEKYKSYKVTLHIVLKGEAVVAKITLDFEKHHQSHDDLKDYMEFVISLAKDIDEHLAGQAD